MWGTGGSGCKCGSALDKCVCRTRSTLCVSCPVTTTTITTFLSIIFSSSVIFFSISTSVAYRIVVNSIGSTIVTSIGIIFSCRRSTLLLSL